MLLEVPLPISNKKKRQPMPGYYTALTRACSFDGFAERRHLMRAETRHRGSHFQARYSATVPFIGGQPDPHRALRATPYQPRKSNVSSMRREPEIDDANSHLRADAARLL